MILVRINYPKIGYLLTVNEMNVQELKDSSRALDELITDQSVSDKTVIAKLDEFERVPTDDDEANEMKELLLQVLYQTMEMRAEQHNPGTPEPKSLSKKMRGTPKLKKSYGLALFKTLVDNQLEKGRKKGGKNVKHKYLARFQDSKGNWIYITPHDKELDGAGNLKEDVNPTSILRRFFGVETENDVKRRLELGIKLKNEYIDKVNDATGKPVSVISHTNQTFTSMLESGKKLSEAIVRTKHGKYDVVTGFELSPEFAGYYKSGLPKTITQFFTPPEELASLQTAQAKVPVGGTGATATPPHVLIPAKDEDGKVVTDINGKVVMVGEIFTDKPPLGETSIHVIHPKVDIEHVEVDAKKVPKPYGYTLKIEEVLKDPLVIEKYGSVAAIQKEARDRPFTLWMAAGRMGGPDLSPQSKNAVLAEWMHTIVRIAQSETNRFRNTTHYVNLNEDTQAPSPKAGMAEHYIKTNLNDYINATVMHATAEWLPGYVAKDNPNDRFDKWFAKRIENYIRDRIKTDLMERGGEPILEGDESEGGRPDVGAGSKMMSPHDYVEYKHYAEAGRKRINDVLSKLPESQRRVITARLWLDDSEAEERRDISARSIKNTKAREAFELGDETEGEPSLARPSFERSFAAILDKYPDGWPFAVDVTTPEGRGAAIKAITRYYEKSIRSLASRMTLNPLDEKLIVSGKGHPDGIVYDPNTNQYFTKDNYAAKRYLELESKRAQAGRSFPNERSFYTKEFNFPIVTGQQGPSLEADTSRPIARHSTASVSRFLPSVAFFENHPVLRERLGLNWGALKMPSSLYSTPKIGSAASVEPIVFEEHHKYGLPQVEHTGLGTMLTPEQSRRMGVLKESHTFMRVISHKKTKDVQTLLSNTKRALTIVKNTLKEHTPRSLVLDVVRAAKGMAHLEPEKRLEAAKATLALASKLYAAEKTVGIGNGLGALVRNVIAAGPMKGVTDARNRVRTIEKHGDSEISNALESKIRQWKDSVVMLDYEIEQRSKVAKARFVGPDTFVQLLHDLDFAIGYAAVV